jgi:hypothetical protein
MIGKMKGAKRVAEVVRLGRSGRFIFLLCSAAHRDGSPYQSDFTCGIVGRGGSRRAANMRGECRGTWLLGESASYLLHLTHATADLSQVFTSLSRFHVHHHHSELERRAFS